MKHFIDPQITVKEALSFSEGSQSKLAKQLGISRASVHEWVSSDREYLPVLQAYRFSAIKASKQKATP